MAKDETLLRAVRVPAKGERNAQGAWVVTEPGTLVTEAGALTAAQRKYLAPRGVFAGGEAAVQTADHVAEQAGEAEAEKPAHRGAAKSRR